MLHDLSRAVGDLAAATGRHIHLVLENDDNAAQPARCRAGSAARQIPRAVERRLSSRLACAADRRDPRLLPRLSTRAAVRHRPRARLRLCLSGRGVRASRRPVARRTERRARADRLHQFPAEPRPDRQPRPRRPARKPVPSPARSKPRWRSPCWRRRSRCCSWARNGARRRRFRSSAISTATSPRPCARAAAGNSPGAYAKYGDEVPDPLDVVDLPIRGAGLGSRATSPRDAERLALVQDLLAIRQREIVPRLAGAAFGDAQAADNGLLTADWRMGDGATLRLIGQSVDHARSPIQRIKSRGTPIWGSETDGPDAALVGVLAHRRAMMPPAIPDRDLPPAAHGEFRFRRRRGRRSLSEGARHQPSLRLAIHEGAQGQHPRL